MCKILLMIVVFAICSIVGYEIGQKYVKRLNELREYKKIIILMQNEILYNNTMIPEALCEVSQKVSEPFKNILYKTSKEISKSDNEENLLEVIERIYVSNETGLHFNKSDISLIKDFIRYLGDTGIYGQEKIFNLALENIKLNLEEAAKEAGKNAKLYRELGMCFGAMTAILLI